MFEMQFLLLWVAALMATFGALGQGGVLWSLLALFAWGIWLLHCALGHAWLAARRAAKRYALSRWRRRAEVHMAGFVMQFGQHLPGCPTPLDSGAVIRGDLEPGLVRPCTCGFGEVCEAARRTKLRSWFAARKLAS